VIGKEGRKERWNILDDPKHPISAVLSSSTIEKRRTSRILIVNSRKHLSRIDYPSQPCSNHSSNGSIDLRFPESKAPASVDLLQTLVPSDRVAECFLSARSLRSIDRGGISLQVLHPRCIREYRPVRLSQRMGLIRRLLLLLFFFKLSVL
jgi:hypothetical protein